jgi:hypothetical protein
MHTYTYICVHTCIQDLAYNVKSALENEPLLRVPKLACNASIHVYIIHTHTHTYIHMYMYIYAYIHAYRISLTMLKVL